MAVGDYHDGDTTTTALGYPEPMSEPTKVYVDIGEGEEPDTTAIAEKLLAALFPASRSLQGP
jgi:hypothetical protein